MNSAPKWIIPLIFVLTLLPALAGLWPAQGTPYPLTTFRGEEVTINARGLCYWDTVSSVAQMQANDLVTLVLGLPLLAVYRLVQGRGRPRGRRGGHASNLARPVSRIPVVRLPRAAEIVPGA